MITKLAVALLLASSLFAQSRPVHTFSIVARDPQTGDIGVAVQSHWFAVGQLVAWAEPGVGAVATQSFVDPSYGPLGLSLMRAGKGAPDALKGLLETDSGADVRQVAMIDAHGHVAAWTGGKDIQAAGHIAGVEKNPQPGLSNWTSRDGGKGDVGEGFSVEANLMSNDKIWPAMAKAYQESKGDLAERMLAALDAAQAAGGDVRGRQSAALIVVSGKRADKPWERLFDLRVDDAAEPLKELRRLVALQRAYNHMNAGDLAVEHHDNEAALREYSTAEQIAASTPGVLPSRLAEMIYWHAVALVNMSCGGGSSTRPEPCGSGSSIRPEPCGSGSSIRPEPCGSGSSIRPEPCGGGSSTRPETANLNCLDRALPLFKKAFALEPGWRTLTPRLPASGLLPNAPKLIEGITAQ